MKAEKCKIGMTVLAYGEFNKHYIVLSLPDKDGYVKVKRCSSDKEDSFYVDTLEEYNEEEIKKLAKEVQSKINKAKSAFEKAFDSYAEAQELVEKSNFSISSLDDAGLINLNNFYNLIEEKGWSASTFRCM